MESKKAIPSTSLVVRQWFAVAVGELPVHSPCNPWPVREVVHESRYCMRCNGERNFDVVHGVNGHIAAFCRACGGEQ